MFHIIDRYDRHSAARITGERLDKSGCRYGICSSLRALELSSTFMGIPWSSPLDTPQVCLYSVRIELARSNIYKVSPVFQFTDPSLGGWGFSPLQISLFLGTAGISQALWTLIIFPPLQHRIGTGGVLRLCYAIWPAFFLMYPVCNLLIRRGWTAAFWTVAPVGLVVGSGVSMAFSEYIRRSKDC